jgi:hypothetical protein
MAVTQSSAQTIVKFDAPGGGTGQLQGTEPTALNIEGQVTGELTDSSNGTHGFLRQPDGQFEANFDAPGADPIVGCTCPMALNDLGVVAGYYLDSGSVAHGFLRSANGNITEFDEPKAGKAANQGTVVADINDQNAVTGYYIDPDNNAHGFVRSSAGKMISFDVAGATLGTYPASINWYGQVAGTFTDGSSVSHGFVRSASGTVTTFQPPPAVGSPVGTYTALISDLGVVSGNLVNTKSQVYVGFLRYPDGHYTYFQPAGAGQRPYYGTYAVSRANLLGATTGFYQDKNLVAHSFIRFADHEPIGFEIPGQFTAPGTTYGSAGVAINVFGLVAGRWHDSNYVTHGFLRLPY